MGRRDPDDAPLVRDRGRRRRRRDRIEARRVARAPGRALGAPDRPRLAHGRQVDRRRPARRARRRRDREEDRAARRARRATCSCCRSASASRSAAIGCFLAGLDDQHLRHSTTSLPWGVDFGDGVPRHPTQLYEIVALGLIAWWAVARRTDALRVERRPVPRIHGRSTSPSASPSSSIKPGRARYARADGDPGCLPRRASSTTSAILRRVFAIREAP